MRSFIAINFNNDTRTQLLKLRDKISSHSKSGNFSRSENIHLTLVFLGDCDGSQIAVAKAALNALVFSPFSFEIDRVGKFRRYGGDIWWAGLKENKSLSSLHNILSGLLRDGGFELENRKFSPHITLGREVVTSLDPWDIEPFGERVTAIELMKSERIQGKLTYSAVHRKRSESS